MPSYLTPPAMATATSPEIVGCVYIDPSAQIDPTAKIGPNVSIGPNVVISKGCRIVESILLEGTVMEKNSVVIWSIVGADCKM